MKTAKAMFEELGYELTKNHSFKNVVIYSKKISSWLSFNVEIYNNLSFECYQQFYHEGKVSTFAPMTVNSELFMAISKQILEIGLKNDTDS